MEAISAKLVLLGESFVGKTAISTRYVKDIFDSNYKGTIGASFLSKSVQIDDYTFDLAIWDTAGQEVYRTLTPMYYRDANMALIVFDLTKRNTFETVKEWVEQVRAHSEKVSIAICGNKADLSNEREVEMNDALALAKELDVPYVEASALTGCGVNEVFEALTQEYLKQNPQCSQQATEDTQEVVDISKPTGDTANGNGGRKCC